MFVLPIFFVLYAGHENIAEYILARTQHTVEASSYVCWMRAEVPRVELIRMNVSETVKYGPTNAKQNKKQKYKASPSFVHTLFAKKTWFYIDHCSSSLTQLTMNGPSHWAVWISSPHIFTVFGGHTVIERLPVCVKIVRYENWSNYHSFKLSLFPLPLIF